MIIDVKDDIGFFGELFARASALANGTRPGRWSCRRHLVWHLTSARLLGSLTLASQPCLAGSLRSWTQGALKEPYPLSGSPSHPRCLSCQP